MDPATLTAVVQGTAALLLPHLPGLAQKVGESAAGEAGKRFTGEAWEQAKAFWARVWPKMEAKPEAKSAVADAIAEPDNPDAQGAFRQQLRKVLQEEPGLAAELARMLEGAKAAGVNVTASGERSVATGGNVIGSTITTGEQYRPTESGGR